MKRLCSKSCFGGQAECSGWGQLTGRAPLRIIISHSWLCISHQTVTFIVPLVTIRTMTLDQDFEAAAETLKTKVNKTLSDDELKEGYAWYKQATAGDINIEKPGVLDIK